MPHPEDRYKMMIKASLPYLSNDTRKLFLTYLKINEVMHTLQDFDKEQEEIFSSSSVNEEERENGLFQAICTFCTPKEQEMINTILNLNQMMKLLKEMEDLQDV
ncbi:MAG: hypothetical protein MSG78_06870 [Clostridiales bacterium]|nr:hypothetical protein [Clostridiales bacterium]